MDIERTKFIKMMLSRCRALKDSAVRTLNDTSVKESGRYSAFKTYAEEYTNIVYLIAEKLDLSAEKLRVYDVENMKGWGRLSENSDAHIMKKW